MRHTIYIICAVIGFSGCAHAPLSPSTERRFFDSFGSGFSNRVVPQSQLVSDGAHLYFGTAKGALYSLNAANGKKRWKIRLDGSIDIPPAVAAGKLYVGTSRGRIYALSSESGEILWDQSVEAEVLGRPYVVGDDLVLFGANDGSVFAVATENGAVKWRYRTNLPDRITIHSFASPLGRKGRLFAGFSDGTVAAIRQNDGSQVWQQSSGREVRFPDVVAPLLSIGDRFVAGQFSGGVRMFRSDGTILWSVEGGGSAAAPIVHEDRIFVGAGQNRIMALALETGAKKWVLDTGESASWSGLARFGEKLLASTFEGRVYVVDVANGTLIWKYDFGASIPGPPVVVGDRVWVLTSRGELFAFTDRS